MPNDGDIDKLIIDKATEDSEFRAALLASPRDALAKYLDIALPDDLTINVLEDSESVLNVVLPPAFGELDDSQLDAVAGGRGTGPIGGCKGCTTGSLGKRIIYTFSTSTDQ
ncbi:MAG: NHLP leader peptide family natural product precursor [Ectothiorhodospiraceae bacterium]|nr:NHLP leader peptide family natural product precursor [Chromatiales bacterium]MCP5154833.1 NHLP leader peptide family natural product precursor [Ectothiorhodospiraceae bacterium]